MTTSRTNPATRAALINAGVAAFLEDGYHGTGLKQILDRVGVPKGSFYNYFESKEAFASASVDHYAECLAGKLASAVAGERSALAGLRAFMVLLMQEFVEAEFAGGCLVANLGAELDNSPLCRAALQRASKAYHESFSDLLTRAQAEGEFRGDLDPVAMGKLLADAWEGAVIRMKIEQSTASLELVMSGLLDGLFLPAK